MSSEAESAIKEVKEDLTAKLTDLTNEVSSMQTQVNNATTLEQLQQIRYGALMDAAGEIETTIDAVPEDVDVEDDEEAGR